MAVEEVGRGVGYLGAASSWDSRARRFVGRGSGGEDDGSKGGRRDADRFAPARELALVRRGEDDSMDSMFFFFPLELVERDLRACQTLEH